MLKAIYAIEPCFPFMVIVAAGRIVNRWIPQEFPDNPTLQKELRSVLGRWVRDPPGGRAVGWQGYRRQNGCGRQRADSRQIRHPPHPHADDLQRRSSRRCGTQVGFGTEVERSAGGSELNFTISNNTLAPICDRGLFLVCVYNARGIYTFYEKLMVGSRYKREGKMPWLQIRASRGGLQR